MVDWFKKVLSKEWNITPAGGLTGDAYFAEKDNRRLFVKRNASPFLAVLSAEGIVPKLVWTKRMENGDVITAQEWMEGRELKPEEMQHHQVANLLRKIHQSTELLNMLMRLGKKPITSDDRFADIQQRLIEADLNRYEEVQEAFIYLRKMLPLTRNYEQVVCHCDLNHNNLLLTNEGHLYLIDWENAMITDPITDYGMVLNSYIPREDWNDWLQKYGVTKDDHLIERMYWYLILDTLHYIAWHSERNEADKVMERFSSLTELNHHVYKIIQG